MDQSPIFDSSGALQPFVECDPFALFALAPVGELDQGELKRAYLQLSKAIHPDRHQSESADIQDAAIAWSTAVNAAYKKLKDPIERLKLLLGVEGNAEASNPAPDFLMEVFEINEFLDEAEPPFDDQQGRELNGYHSTIKDKRAAAKAQVDELLKRFDKGEEREQLRNAFAECQSQSRYLERLNARIEALINATT